MSIIEGCDLHGGV